MKSIFCKNCKNILIEDNVNGNLFLKCITCDEKIKFTGSLIETVKDFKEDDDITEIDHSYILNDNEFSKKVYGIDIYHYDMVTCKKHGKTKHISNGYNYFCAKCLKND